MASARIMIVEDEGVVASYIEKALELEGYQVTAVVSSGEEAVEKAAETRPDLVLMDIHLAGEMDGVEAAEQLRNRFSIPVIYLTGHADDDILQRAKVTEPLGYIMKPFGPEDLLTTLEVGLYRHRAEEALRESEERYRYLVENLPVGVGYTSPEGKVFYHNPYAQQMMGYTLQDLDELRAQDLYVHIEDWDDLIRNLEEKGEHTYEYQIRRKDGQVIWVRGTTRPVRDETGKIIRYQGVSEDVTERRRQEALHEALHQLREIVWKMQRPEDIAQVVAVLRENLKNLGIPFHEADINLLYDPGGSPEHSYALSQQRKWTEWGSEDAWKTIRRIWRAGEVAYRRDLEREDIYQENAYLEELFGGPVRCVLDVPFSHGTLAINSTQAEAFSEQDIAVLQALAEVLSEGFTRLGDLQSLEQHNQELEEKDRLLTAFHRMGQVILSSINMERILDNLTVQIFNTGLFRSLTISVVDAAKNEYEVVRNYIRRDEDGNGVPGGKSATRGNDPVVGYRCGLDDPEDLAARAFRRGEVTVIKGWGHYLKDDRQTAVREDDPHPGYKVAYFIPVKKEDRVLAVLATGSQPEEEEVMRRRIEAMQPLLDQVAIALDHSQLYETVQREVSERKQAEVELLKEQRIFEGESAVRLKIASMDQPEDLASVVEEISDQLKRLGVDHDSSSLQVVNPEGTDFVSVGRGDAQLDKVITGSWGVPSSNPEEYPWVIEAWKTGRSLYQPRLPERYGPLSGCSLIDVPFSQGTLAINRRRSHAFDEATAIPLLERFAGVLSGGFQRLIDIVRHTQAEEALRESQERYRRFVENAPAILYQVSNKRGGLYWSSRVETILGFDLSKVKDALYLWHNAIHPDDKPKVDQAIEGFSRGDPMDIEYRIQDTRGNWHWFHDRSIGRIDAGDEVIIEGIAVDITARKQLEEQRERAMQADRLQALGEMAAGVAHELNQPLTGIRWFAEDMAFGLQEGDEFPPKEIITTCEKIVAQVDRMTTIINHMRAFSREHSAEETASFEVRNLIEDTLTLVGAQLKTHGIELAVEISEDLPECRGWPFQIEQVLLNLISNARDALDDRQAQVKAGEDAAEKDWQPVIAIRASNEEEERVRIEIADTGGGIPEEVLPRVFEPFFTTKEVGRGTGLGLALSQTLMQQQGGGLEVDNRPGEGVTLSILLPICARGASDHDG